MPSMAILFALWLRLVSTEAWDTAAAPNVDAFLAVNTIVDCQFTRVYVFQLVRRICVLTKPINSCAIHVTAIIRGVVVSIALLIECPQLWLHTFLDDESDGWIDVEPLLELFEVQSTRWGNWIQHAFYDVSHLVRKHAEVFLTSNEQHNMALPFLRIFFN